MLNLSRKCKYTELKKILKSDIYCDIFPNFRNRISYTRIRLEIIQKLKAIRLCWCNGNIGYPQIIFSENF